MKLKKNEQDIGIAVACYATHLEFAQIRWPIFSSILVYWLHPWLCCGRSFMFTTWICFLTLCCVFLLSVSLELREAPDKASNHVRVARISQSIKITLITCQVLTCLKIAQWKPPLKFEAGQVARGHCTIQCSIAVSSEWAGDLLIGLTSGLVSEPEWSTDVR